MSDTTNNTTAASADHVEVPQPKQQRNNLVDKVNKAIRAEAARSGRKYRDYDEQDIVQACVDKVHGLMYRYDRNAEERAVIKAWRAEKPGRSISSKK